MTGRALVFSNPEVARLAGERFVPYAGDKWYLSRQQDADGAFLRKVCAQRTRRNSQNSPVPQGIYIATADGRLLDADHFHPDPARMLRLLNTALEAGGAAEAVQLASTAGEADRQYARTPPEGGLILKVFTRIPLESPGGKWTPNDATGRDHMWLTRDEWRSLVPAQWENGRRHAVPPAVAERLIRFHLVDNIRGEPPMWTRDEIRRQDLALVVEDAASGKLRLEGTAQLQTADGQRGYEARLQGFLKYDRAGERFARADLLAWGDAWGQGPFTRGAPQGRFPLLIRFSLAGTGGADRVPPQGSRELAAYLGTGR